MIIHCTAGKDRTGVAIAMLLALLGVSSEQIMVDYTRSDVFGHNMRVAGSLDHAFHQACPNVSDLDMRNYLRKQRKGCFQAC
jgi:protein-tyrosine phosphatase